MEVCNPRSRFQLAEIYLNLPLWLRKNTKLQFGALLTSAAVKKHKYQQQELCFEQTLQARALEKENTVYHKSKSF